MKKIAWMLVFVFVFNICFADMFLMVDGTVIHGTIMSNDDPKKVKIKTTTGEIIKVDKKDIAKPLPDDAVIKQPETTALIPTVAVMEITDQQLRQQQYLSYIALKELAESNKRLAESTETIKMIMAWEFGLAIAAVVVSTVALMSIQSKTGTP